MEKVILKDGMTVIAPCDGTVVKKGQEFIVYGVTEGLEPYCQGFHTLIDETEAFCLLNECAHINDKNWIIK